MSIRRRGKAWQVRVPGWPDLTVPTREAAETIELDRKLRSKLGHLYVEEPITFGHALDLEVARRQAIKTLRPATIRFNEQCAAPWEPIRGVKLNRLRRALVEDHIIARALAAPTAARNELQFAKAALRSAESRGQRVDVGIYAISPIRTTAARGHALDLDELAELASWMPARVTRIVTICGTVGLRWKEAVSLDDSMVDLDASLLSIPAQITKERRDKPIPLAAFEVQTLREQLLIRPAGATLVFPTARGDRYSESGFRKVWHRALEKADREGFKFHWLRHTAISLMATAGMKPELIAERVGHSDGGALIMRRYRHLYPREVTAAVTALDKLVTAAKTARKEASA